MRISPPEPSDLLGLALQEAPLEAIDSGASSLAGTIAPFDPAWTSNPLSGHCILPGTVMLITSMRFMSLGIPHSRSHWKSDPLKQEPDSRGARQNNVSSSTSRVLEDGSSAKARFGLGIGRSFSSVDDFLAEVSDRVNFWRGASSNGSGPEGSASGH